MNLYRRGSVQPTPDENAVDCVAFYRRELERQRELHEDVNYWYIMPFVPGLLVWIFWPDQPGHRTLQLGLLAFAALLFVIISLRNKQAARKLDHEMRALPK